MAEDIQDNDTNRVVGKTLGDKSSFLLGGILSAALSIVVGLVLLILLVVFDWYELKDTPESQRNFLILLSVWVGVWFYAGGTSFASSNKGSRKCPLCEADWAITITGYIKNIDESYIHKNVTRQETRGSGDSRQERTLDIKEKYKIREYDEIYKCASCQEESTKPQSTKTLVDETITATTPWQRG